MRRERCLSRFLRAPPAFFLPGTLDPPICDDLGFPQAAAMGALTDSRKRVSADHRLPFPSVPPLCPPPPSKRPKLAPFPSLHPTQPTPPPPRIPSAAATAASTSSAASSTTDCSPLPHRRRLPPPPPNPRSVHGPQRVLRAFRLGPARPPSAPSWFSPPTTPPWSLGLEQYVELVNSVSKPPPPTPGATPDVVREAEAAPIEIVAVQDDGDDRKDQDDDEEVVRGSVGVRSVPLYKELYEASIRKRDARLRSLEFEVRLAEEGRLGLERLAEVLPRITPKKEVHLACLDYFFLIS